MLILCKLQPSIPKSHAAETTTTVTFKWYDQLTLDHHGAAWDWGRQPWPHGMRTWTMTFEMVAGTPTQRYTQFNHGLVCCRMVFRPTFMGCPPRTVQQDPTGQMSQLVTHGALGHEKVDGLGPQKL